VAAVTEADETTQRILDATRASVLAFGVRRTTLADIARRAGVSRMTVYRRYPDAAALLRDLMTRELGGLVAGAAEGGAGEPIAHRLAEAAIAVRGHPLMRKVMDAEPELLISYVVDRMGATQQIAHATATRAIESGQAEGSIRAGDPAMLAQMVLLIVQSFVFSASINEEVPADDLLAELEPLLSRALAP
jgi:AcrR family transcriptional regulator